MKNIVIIAHNIRSLHNVGSIFRTAEGAGVDKIFLTGYTGCPPKKEIAKVALGSENMVPWVTLRGSTRKFTRKYAEKISQENIHPVKTIGELIKCLKGEGYQIVCLEQAKDAIGYKKYKPSGKIALIIGNEVRGVSKSLQRLADVVIEIPMLGARKSLNVSVAFGIAIFYLAERMNAK